MDFFGRTAVLDQLRHQDGAVTCKTIELRIHLLGIEKDLDDRAEIGISAAAAVARDLAAKADLISLVLVLDRDRFKRAAVGWAIAKRHAACLSSFLAARIELISRQPLSLGRKNGLRVEPSSGTHRNQISTRPRRHSGCIASRWSRVSVTWPPLQQQTATCFNVAICRLLRRPFVTDTPR